jgi:hypothetical protein
MRGLVVLTGLDQLPPAERWPRLVAPLAAALAESGLGHLPDFASLERDAAESGALNATEVAVSLANLAYGRSLVRRVAEAACIRVLAHKVPERWRDYGCFDYFASPFAEQGYYDEAGQYWYIVPADEVYEDSERPFLVIGGPGVDGINWGYRAGQTGLWAYYPLDQEFVWLAPTAKALLEGWRSGAITV